MFKIKYTYDKYKLKVIKILQDSIDIHTIDNLDEWITDFYEDGFSYKETADSIKTLKINKK